MSPRLTRKEERLLRLCRDAVPDGRDGLPDREEWESTLRTGLASKGEAASADALREAGDTWEGMPLKDYLKIAESIDLIVIGRAPAHGGDFYYLGRESDSALLSLRAEGGAAKEARFTRFMATDAWRGEDAFAAVGSLVTTLRFRELSLTGSRPRLFWWTRTDDGEKYWAHPKFNLFLRSEMWAKDDDLIWNRATRPAGRTAILAEYWRALEALRADALPGEWKHRVDFHATRTGSEAAALHEEFVERRDSRPGTPGYGERRP